MLYERIKELCRQNGTSISALEKDCGFGRGSISKIDKHKPSNEKLQKIAEYLGVTVDQLTGVQTDVQHDGYYFNESTAKTAQQIYEDPYLRILFDAAQDSRPEDLQMAADLLRRLKQSNPDG
jgi:transcriptional regulator with XRE-family HTH domain